MTQNNKKQITHFVSFGSSPELISLPLFSQLLFSGEILKIKSINLTFYFITLIFKFSRFMMDFGIVFENFFADRKYQQTQKHQGRLLM